MSDSSAEVFDYEERRRGLKKLWHKAKASQREVAALSGVSHFSICRYLGGKRDLLPSALERIEAALSDIMAGQKLTTQLHARRTQTVPLSQMAPPSSSAKEHQQARDRFVQRGSQRMTELIEQNANLREQVASLREMVGILKRQEQNWHEAFVLQDEVIRQQEALLPNKSKEAAAMLRRAKLLKAGAR